MSAVFRKAGGLAFAALLLTLPFGAAPAHAAEETHLFSATLSLTGDCSTSTIDPVPDPGLCPGTPGVDHPSKPFSLPKGVAVDTYGDRYVASYGPESANPNQGRIDVFGPDGSFITELADPNGPKAIAVDSEGNLYVHESLPGETTNRIVRYSPTPPFNPAAGEISYDESPLVFIATDKNAVNGSVAVDTANDHLFFDYGQNIWEFSSAVEGNVLLSEEIGAREGELKTKNSSTGSEAMAVDAAHKRIYADRHDPVSGGNVVLVFDLEAPYELLGTIDGSKTPAGEFLADQGQMSLAVEESTGHLFVGDLGSARKVYELEVTEDAEGNLHEGYVSTITPSNGQFGSLGWRQMAVDNAPESPSFNTLYVPSGESTPGHSFAFAPKPPLLSPVVESLSFSGVTGAEAQLRAVINPNGQKTTYRFQYTTQASFQAEGFASAITASEGTIAPASEGRAVSATARGLAPATTYRFRIIAENESGEAEAQSSFTTRRTPDLSSGCANEALRSGASAFLPDCRAYELVSPSNTNGRIPFGIGSGAAPRGYPILQASPAGDRVSFSIWGGAIPGFEGAGGFNGDAYLSTREAGGWSTTPGSANGAEATGVDPRGVSPDQRYAFWGTGGGGSLPAGTYLRYPDGHSEPIGRGSLGADPRAEGKLLAEGASHVLFITPAGTSVQLEPNAPTAGTEAIYDRTADEVTHVVSLLPEDITPAAGQNAFYLGASAKGTEVAFTLGDEKASPIYLRADDAKTLIAAPPGSTFAGIAEGGGRLFYLKGGDLYAFDRHTEEAIRFTESGDVTPVNVPSGGQVAYFLSPSVLVGEDQPNPSGALPTEGKENLYRSQEGQIAFLATVTDLDALNKTVPNQVSGLGIWVEAVGDGTISADTSRATPDGNVLLFESRAKLTEYDSEGKDEVYRYDASTEALTCLSCDPTGAPPTGDSHLQSLSNGLTSPFPLRTYSLASNLRADGARAFFESPDALVGTDTDGLQDVYEWEEEGVGSCRTKGGCVYLISSGRSSHPDYLFAASQSGDDVFVETADLLLPASDPDEAPSIYDARVNGGFPLPPAPPGECLGEACQPAVSAPGDPIPGVRGAGNVRSKKAQRRCPKGRRAVHKAGKLRCAPKRRAHRKRHRRHHRTHRRTYR